MKYGKKSNRGSGASGAGSSSEGDSSSSGIWEASRAFIGRKSPSKEEGPKGSGGSDRSDRSGSGEGRTSRSGPHRERKPDSHKREAAAGKKRSTRAPAKKGGDRGGYGDRRPPAYSGREGREKREDRTPVRPAPLPVIHSRKPQPEKPTAQDSFHDLERSLKGDHTAPLEKGKPHRINRYLAAAGYGSRREVEQFVLDGRVEINGRKVEGLDTRVEPGDLVFVDGTRVNLPEESFYYAMNKPVGYVVTKKGYGQQKTIYSLLPPHLQNLKYAGRLDLQSRGVLILSNDGAFLNAVTHPGRRLTKRYIVTVQPLPPEAELQRKFYRGIEDEGELLRAIRVTVLDRASGRVEVVLGEGKNRQIRRMFKSLGIKVLDLYREAVGFFDLAKTPVPEGEILSISPTSVLYGKKAPPPEEREILGDFDPWKKGDS